MRGVRARYDAVLPPFISVVRSPSHPVMSIPDLLSRDILVRRVLWPRGPAGILSYTSSDASSDSLAKLVGSCLMGYGIFLARYEAKWGIADIFPLLKLSAKEGYRTILGVCQAP